MLVAVFQSVTCCKWKNFMMSYVAALPKPSSFEGKWLRDFMLACMLFIIIIVFYILFLFTYN